MQIIKIILSVIFIIDCIALTVVVLMQEGKQQGLGAIAGAAETYWGKNKGRSMEGGLVKATTIMGILFFCNFCSIKICLVNQKKKFETLLLCARVFFVS